MPCFYFEAMISRNKYYLSGREKFERKDFEGALADYNRCIAEEENPNVYSERGVVYFHLKNLSQSLADMDYAAALEPENPYRYASRAYIKDAMGDLEGAITDYEKAVQLDPEDSIAHNNLGLLLEKRGYQQKAASYFKKADQLAEMQGFFANPAINSEKLDQALKSDASTLRSNSNQGDEEKKPGKPTLWKIVKQTFTTSSGIKEYFRFLKNGFKP